MSVFATHTKTRHVRTIGILIGLCAVIAGGAFAGSAVRGVLTAAIGDVVVVPSPSAMPTETVFPQSRDIEWEGIIVGTLAGGRGLAIQREDTGELFQAYMPDNTTASVSKGPVNIKGTWTGISCAYQQTVFNGRCTPSVDIHALEILPTVQQ